MNKFILFDVGTNWGDDSLPKAASNSNVEVFAFEPTPNMVVHLANVSRSFSDRYHIYQVAVADYDGVGEFFIQNNPGGGCNSLNHFDPDMISTHWKGWTPGELTASHSIPVKIIKLETWFKDHPEITKIDHFHCDTQGNDLKVLKGMGPYIKLIKTGVVEAAQPHIKLYKESTTAGEMVDFLMMNDFKITKFEPVDSLYNEWNIHFESKS